MAGGGLSGGRVPEFPRRRGRGDRRRGPVGLLPVLLLYWLSEWWLTRRAQRDWDRGEPERQRRWAEEDRRQALQQQLRELEEATREEQLSDDAREWRRQYRAREAEITREARRRLGLPEKEG
jgi:hypothetical protein